MIIVTLCSLVVAGASQHKYIAFAHAHLQNKRIRQLSCAVQLNVCFAFFFCLIFFLFRKERLNHLFTRTRSNVFEKRRPTIRKRTKYSKNTKIAIYGNLAKNLVGKNAKNVLILGEFLKGPKIQEKTTRVLSQNQLQKTFSIRKMTTF